VILSVTGLYIADPFLIPLGGDLFSTIRFVHIVTALAFLLSGIWRTYWLLAGNRFARWSAFIPTTRYQATELFQADAKIGYTKRKGAVIEGKSYALETYARTLFPAAPELNLWDSIETPWQALLGSFQNEISDQQALVSRTNGLVTLRSPSFEQNPDVDPWTRIA